VHHGISCTTGMPGICDLWTLGVRSSVRGRSTPTAPFASSPAPDPREAYCASPDTPGRPDPSPIGRSSCRNRLLRASRLSGSEAAERQILFSSRHSRAIGPHCADPENNPIVMLCDSIVRHPAIFAIFAQL